MHSGDNDLLDSYKTQAISFTGVHIQYYKYVYNKFQCHSFKKNRTYMIAGRGSTWLDKACEKMANQEALSQDFLF